MTCLGLIQKQAVAKRCGPSTVGCRNLQDLAPTRKLRGVKNGQKERRVSPRFWGYCDGMRPPHRRVYGNLNDCSFRLRKATKSCGGQQHTLQGAYTHGVAQRLCGLHRTRQGKVQHDIIPPPTDHTKPAQYPDGTCPRPPESGGSGRDKRHPPVARAATRAAPANGCSSRRADGSSRRQRQPVVAAAAGGGGRRRRQGTAAAEVVAGGRGGGTQGRRRQGAGAAAAGSGGRGQRRRRWRQEAAAVARRGGGGTGRRARWRRQKPAAVTRRGGGGRR